MIAPAYATDPDGAFFYDWRQWLSLDDLPERPRNNSTQPVRWGHVGLARWSRYYCILRASTPTPDRRAGFEIAIPQSDSVYAALNRIPIMTYRAPVARQKVVFVDALHHAKLRRALPTLKSSVISWIREDH